MNRFRAMAIQNYTMRLTAVILDLNQPEVETFDPPTRKPCHEPNAKWVAWPVAEIWPLDIFQDSAGRYLNLAQPEVAPFDPQTSKTLS